MTVTELVDAFAGPVAILQQRIARLLPQEEQQRDTAEIEGLVAAGVPAAELGQPLVRLQRTADLLEIHQIAADLEASPDMAGQVYYRVCDLVDFGGIRETLSTLGAQATNGRWDQRATEGLTEGLMYARRQLTRNVLLDQEEGVHVEHCLAAYRERHAEQLEKLRVLVNDVKSARQPTLAALVVVMRELGRLTTH
jgi:NAD-specific glutamate dehydrogenase